jgi:hypothetical protein
MWHGREWYDTLFIVHDIEMLELMQLIKRIKIIKMFQKLVTGRIKQDKYDHDIYKNKHVK